MIKTVVQERGPANPRSVGELVMEQSFPRRLHLSSRVFHVPFLWPIFRGFIPRTQYNLNHTLPGLGSVIPCIHILDVDADDPPDHAQDNGEGCKKEPAKELRFMWEKAHALVEILLTAAAAVVKAFVFDIIHICAITLGEFSFGV